MGRQYVRPKSVFDVIDIAMRAHHFVFVAGASRVLFQAPTKVGSLASPLSSRVFPATRIDHGSVPTSYTPSRVFQATDERAPPLSADPVAMAVLTATLAVAGFWIGRASAQRSEFLPTDDGRVRLSALELAGSFPASRASLASGVWKEARTGVVPI